VELDGECLAGGAFGRKRPASGTVEQHRLVPELVGAALAGPSDEISMAEVPT
jgi:hypothetical protein